MSRRLTALRTHPGLDAVRQVARNPSLRRLEAAWTLAMTADQAFLVVALVVAYESGGIVAVSLVGLARTLPALAVALGVDVERTGRPEAVLLASSIVRALTGLAAAGAVLAAETILPAGEGAVVIVAAALLAAAGVLIRPSANALRPALATSPGELVAANVAASAGEGVGTFVGPLLAGLALPLLGAGWTLAAIAVVLGVAAVAAVVQVSEAARSSPHRHGSLPVVTGIRLLVARPAAGAVMIGFGAQILVRGLLLVLVVVLAVEQLGLGDTGVGGLTAAIGAGGLLGGLASLGLAGRTRLAPAFAVALVAWGAPIAVIGLIPAAGVAVLAFVVVGVANAALDIAGFTLLQRTARGGERGPIFAVLEVIVALGLAAGTAVAPALVGLVGIEAALIVTGSILPVTAGTIWATLRRADDEAVIPAAQLALLRGVPMLRLLPLAALERLAADATERTFAAGDVLVREGDPGDAYYVLAAGRVAVVRDGVTIRHLERGEGFGDIALLRTSARTATIVAREPTTVLVIGRGAFLAAVTGHAGSSAVATESVEARLTEDRGRDEA